MVATGAAAWAVATAIATLGFTGAGCVGCGLTGTGTSCVGCTNTVGAGATGITGCRGGGATGAT